MFKSVSPKLDVSSMEENVLKLWKKQDVFKKTIEQRKGKPEYVFYEGPPTANGRPGVHHVLARAFKDMFPRYKIMRGYHVSRRGGWDTHGLPVEIEVEKPAYVTYENEYMESVWWILKNFWDKDLLFKGYKVVPYCPRCGTPLSDHEVALGYEEVSDPSVFVRMPLVDKPDTSLSLLPRLRMWIMSPSSVTTMAQKRNSFLPSLWLKNCSRMKK